MNVVLCSPIDQKRMKRGACEPEDEVADRSMLVLPKSDRESHSRREEQPTEARGQDAAN